MGNWTITVAQKPIILAGVDTGQYHNMILIRDDTGQLLTSSLAVPDRSRRSPSRHVGQITGN